MKGYFLANEVESKINRYLEEERIQPSNVFEWIKFARTVKTSCDIILEECQSILNSSPFNVWRDK